MAKSRVAIILDGSSSMQSIRDEAIGAFNEQVEVLHANSKEVETKVSLVEFGTEVKEPTIWNRRTSKLTPLTKDQYNPSGMTALHDALGTTINKLTALPEANDPDTAFLVVVISDGAENNSKTYTPQFLKQRIQELEKTGRYTFSYIGANQDMFNVSQSLGINIGNTLAFDASEIGTRNMSTTYAAATTNYIGGLKRGKLQAKAMFVAPADEPEITSKTA